MKIRTLRADEVDVRVQTVKENGCSVLLYKDARCDMNILDEVFGPLGWEREHQLINGNLFCTVRVWDEERNRWVSKQDVGTESFTEKEKGQASDSFKRACFNLGIGRELYSAPFVWINLNSGETYKGNKGNLLVKTKFHISKIGYSNNREITALEIKDDNGKVRYTLGKVTLDPNELLEEKHKRNTTKTSTNTTTNNSTKSSTDDSTNTDGDTCSICNIEIKPAVRTYSTKYYGRALCLDCQNKNSKIG